MIPIRSIFRSKLIWILILFLVFYITYVFSDKYAKILQLREDIKKLEIEIKSMKAKNKDLCDKIESLKEEKSIEKIAREELGLVKPDEILIKGIE